MTGALRVIWVASVYGSLGCSAAVLACSMLDGPDRFDHLPAQGRFAYAALALGVISVVALFAGLVTA